MDLASALGLHILNINECSMLTHVYRPLSFLQCHRIKVICYKGVVTSMDRISWQYKELFGKCSLRMHRKDTIECLEHTSQRLCEAELRLVHRLRQVITHKARATCMYVCIHISYRKTKCWGQRTAHQYLNIGIIIRIQPQVSISLVQNQPIQSTPTLSARMKLRMRYLKTDIRLKNVPRSIAP